MEILVILLSYLMGSFPSGYIIMKKKLNIDIRDFGSGNIGTTNVKRVAKEKLGEVEGKKIGNIVASLDMLKAIVPVLLTEFLLYSEVIKTTDSLILGLVAISAILGHNFTIFLKFKGGKGVATSAAAFLCILPIPFFITAIVFFGMKLFTKIVSIRSLSAGIVLPITTILLGYDKYLIACTSIACILVFFTHRQNIKRLIKGEES